MQLLFKRQSHTNLPMSSLARRGHLPRDDRPYQSLEKPKPQKAKEDLHLGHPIMVLDPQSKTWCEGIVTNVRDEP